MLRRKRGDYLLDYQIPVEQARQRLNMEELPYLRLTQVPIHFIVSRHAQDAEAIVEALDQAYETLRGPAKTSACPPTEPHCPRGLALAVGSAISGSSGQ